MPRGSGSITSGRRAIVESMSGSGTLDAATARRCLAGSDADCALSMRSNASLDHWSMAPASIPARRALVEQALVDGGPGSLGAFIAAGDTITVALGAAAKQPLDSVVAQWQRHVRFGAIRSDAFTPGIALLSIGWILAMAVMATRSSRWR